MSLMDLLPISKKEGKELRELLLEINKNNEIIKEKYEKTIASQNKALELTLSKLEIVLSDNKALINSHKEINLKLEEYQNNNNKNNEIIKENHEKITTFQNEALKKLNDVSNDNKTLMKNHKEVNLRLEEYQNNNSKNNEVIIENYEKATAFQSKALKKLDDVFNNNKALINSHKEIGLRLEGHQNNITDLENKSKESSNNMTGLLNIINKILFKDLLKNHKKEIEKIIEN